MESDIDRTKARSAKEKTARPDMLLAIAAFGAVIFTARGASALVTPACGGFTCTSNNGNPLPAGSNSSNQTPQIIISFWGSAWNQATQVPTRGQLIGATESLVTGPYFSQLNEYRGQGVIGLPRMAPYAPIYTFSTPPTKFTLNSVGNVVNDEINRGMLPTPVSGVNMIYVLFLPAGSSSTGGFPAANTTYKWTPAGGGNTITYRIAWLTTNGSTAAVATSNTTTLLSHELVEAITGYQNVSIGNCTNDPGNGESNNQISDYCQCSAAMETQNGYLFEGYYSGQLGGCVIPEAWGGVSEIPNPVSSASFQQISGMPVRQIYGGVPYQGSGVPSMLIATDVNDNLFMRSGNGWVEIGGTGAIFAIGTNTIARVSQDASNVLSYNLATFAPTWISLGTPNGQPVTSLTVTGDDWIVATDPGGNPFVFNQRTNSWQQFGNPGDEFVATNHGVLGLTPGQNAIFNYDSSEFVNGGGWFYSAPAASQIIANPCEEGISWGAISLDSAQNFLMPTVVTGASAFAWSTQTGPGYSFATGGPFDGTTGMLDLNQGQVPRVADTANTAAVPNWTELPGFPGQAGRAVGTCDLVATGTTTVEGPSTIDLLGKCVDVPGWNVNAGYVQVWDCNGGSNQQWIYYGDNTIRPAFDLTMCLDAMVANPQDGQVVGLSKCVADDLTQEWVQAGNVGGLFEWKNAWGRCLNAANGFAGQDTTDGTQYILWDCVGSANELFSF